MPEASKQQVLSLCQTHDIAIIEDDIYGELYFGLQRPRSIYSYDEQGIVLLCSSFSKMLSRDLRLGWIAAGRYSEAVSKLKLATTLASSRVSQQGLSQYIAEGGLDRHLRRTRLQYRKRCQQLLGLVRLYFPMALSCSQPDGGLALWVELPNDADTVKLYNLARLKGIVLTPGRLFTAQERYRNFLRISFAHPWTEARQQALLDTAGLLLLE
jgi:DNA-binding transcriptional MocR family regulator